MSSFQSLLGEAEAVRYFKLGDVCEILLCGTRFGNEFYKDSGFPVLTERNIQNGQIVEDDLSYCDPEQHPKASVIKYGDVVLSRSGKVGISLIDRDFFFISTIFKFVPDERSLVGRYLYHFLLNHPDRINQLMRDGRLRKADLKEWEIPIPSLEEQERICQSLDNFLENKGNACCDSCCSVHDQDLQETPIVKTESF